MSIFYLFECKGNNFVENDQIILRKITNIIEKIRNRIKQCAHEEAISFARTRTIK